MLTGRGWWCFLVSVALVVSAALLPPRGHTSLVLIGLTLLLWFLGQWLLFHVRTDGLRQRLLLVRELHDERGPVANLWAGRSFTVRVRLHLRGWMGLPFARVEERIPFAVESSGPTPLWQGPLDTDQPLEMTYRIHCPAVGVLRFEGLKVEVADLQGFFYQRLFLAVPQLCRVLPPLVDSEGHSPTSKRHNLLPPPGTHRLRRPGSGAELLDLRDYLPGDPPKLIAWKVSARRDRLITKEFESEVPVRCTLFVDASASVRLGPPGRNALARIAEISAAVAQATVGARDLIGLAICDEETSSYQRPARTPRHLAEVLNRLADAAGLPSAPSPAAPVEKLLPLAYAFANETYPQLLRPQVNSFPFWLAWLKPPPVWTMQRPTFADYLYRRMPIWLILWALAGLGALGGLVYFWGRVLLLNASRGIASDERLMMAAGVVASSFALLTAWYAIIPLRLFFPRRRRWYRWRKQLSALFSVRYGLAPVGLPELLEDHDKFAHYLQRFLADHQIPYSQPLYDRQGRFLFAAPAKLDVLAKALLNAVSRSHDNELFVLLVDLLELRREMAPLLRAVKVAVSRHHKVLVVCPWPPGVPPPTQDERSNVLPLAHGPLRPVAEVTLRLTDVLRQATTLRYHESFFQLRRSLARLGVPVLCARGEDPVPLIVERLDQLRTMRSGPRHCIPA